MASVGADFRQLETPKWGSRETELEKQVVKLSAKRAELEEN